MHKREVRASALKFACILYTGHGNRVSHFEVMDTAEEFVNFIQKGGENMENPRVAITIGGETTEKDLTGKSFKSGSQGFYHSWKLDGPGDTRYQCQVQLVEIGSKSKGNAPDVDPADRLEEDLETQV